MKHIPLSSIRVAPDRQREFHGADDLWKLSCDILDKGLMHPIVVRRQADGVYELVAGLGRLLTITDLHHLGADITHEADAEGIRIPIPAGTIPATDLGELDDLAAKEFEYAENEFRFNLSWQERDAALAELHELRSEQAQARGEVQTIKATAQEAFPARTATHYNAAAATVSNALLLRPHMADPEVARAKTQKEALKIVEKKVTRAALEAKAAHLKLAQTSSRHRLGLGDARLHLFEIPTATVDVLITDPPYGIGAQDFGSQFTKPAAFDDSKQKWVQDMEMLGQQSYRVTKEQAHAYVFCDPRNFAELVEIFERNGWTVWQWPLIWHKTGANGALPRPDHGPRRQYEAILYALRGDRPTLRVDSDVLSIARESDDLHPHRKPKELYLNLLRRSARPGDTILDPFAGTGVVFEAANEMQLTAIGFELDEAMYAIAHSKLGD